MRSIPHVRVGLTLRHRGIAEISSLRFLLICLDKTWPETTNFWIPEPNLLALQKQKHPFLAVQTGKAEGPVTPGLTLPRAHYVSSQIAMREWEDDKQQWPITELSLCL